MTVAKSCVSPFRKRTRAFKFADVFDLLIINATNIAGANGDPIQPTDEVQAIQYTNATSGLRPTLATSWQGGKALAFSGSQFVSANNPVFGGKTKLTVVFVLQFTSTSSFRVPFFFGNNGGNNGFDFDIGRRASAGHWAIDVVTKEAIECGAADTNAHFGAITYDGSASTGARWKLSLDGSSVDISAQLADTLVDPTTRSVLGATDLVPNFGFAGKLAFLGCASSVLTAGQIASARTLAKSIWSLP